MVRFKKSRHPRENGGPCHTNPLWIPAIVGMTKSFKKNISVVTPVKTGEERRRVLKKVVTPVKTGVHVIPTHYGFSPNAVRIGLPS